MSFTQVSRVGTATYPPLVLSSRFDAETALDQLGKILIKYDSWRDPLSLRLFKWGAKAVSVDLAGGSLGSAEWIAARTQIDKLRHKILVNPLDGSPLQHPVLEREWTWEGWQLEHYRTLHPQSPFDGERLTSLRPHDFALEMLAWIGSLRFVSCDFPASILERSLITRDSCEMDPAFQVFIYCQLARNAVLASTVKEGLRGPMKEATQAYANLWRKTQELIHQQTELAEKRAALHEQNIHRRIECIEQAHQATTDVLQDRIEEGMRQLHITQGHLNEAKTTCSLQEADIRRLRALYAQKAQEVEDLRRSSSKSLCTIS